MTPYQRFVTRWKDCDRCELCTQRHRIVLARGHVPCNLLLIGEAPGPSEDVLGKPFVGPAGKLLDAILANALEHTRGVRVGITNLVCCFPAEAKKSEPPAEAIKACVPRLNEFVKLCQPRVIIAVGSLAKKWLPRVLRDFDGPVLGMKHPAAILRANVASRGLDIQRCEVVVRDAVLALDQTEVWPISHFGTFGT